MTRIDLSTLATEAQNPATLSIDQASSLEIVRLINQEDAKIAPAIQSALPEIATAVDEIVAALRAGGRLIYLGAGTSGRLGILDASECPPTYNTAPEQVVGIIAGGKDAVFRSIEGAEDDPNLAAADLSALGLSERDVVVGIAASGRTPYVIGGLNYAKALGVKTVAVTCTENNAMQQVADIAITAVVGAEVVSGSTRMKAGTAQKMILNMLTTASMIRLGKVYKNLMVDVKPANAKLVQRQRNILCAATGCDEATAQSALETTGGEVKTAIVMLLLGCSLEQARQQLERTQGVVHQALSS